MSKRPNKYTKAVQDAEASLYLLRQAMAEEIEAERQKIIGCYAERVERDKAALAEAKALFAEEQKRIDAETAAAVTDPRIGKIYVKWTRGHFGIYPWRETGKRGVVEVIGPQQGEVEFGGYSASVGNLCIRHLLVNGERGKRAVPFWDGEDGGNVPYGWFPEGVTPTSSTLRT